MDDTTPEVRRIHHEMLMRRSPEERLRMAFSMYDAARLLVEAGIRMRHPDISPAEMKRQVFLRFYGDEFDDDQKKRILEALSCAAPPPDAL
jgi:hypothetical protein